MSERVYVYVWVFVYVCVCVSVYACVRACVRVCYVCVGIVIPTLNTNSDMIQARMQHAGELCDLFQNTQAPSRPLKGVALKCTT